MIGARKGSDKSRRGAGFAKGLWPGAAAGDENHEFWSFMLPFSYQRTYILWKPLFAEWSSGIGPEIVTCGQGGI